MQRVVPEVDLSTRQRAYGAGVKVTPPKQSLADVSTWPKAEVEPPGTSADLSQFGVGLLTDE